MKAEQTGIRIRRLRLYASPAVGRTYEVDFTSGGTWKPLSIIAGASQTGKTSAIEYILYCLGDSSYPEHEEMVSRVVSAAIEIEVDGFVHTIERATVGGPSKFASVWVAGMDDRASAMERRLIIEPPGSSESLSRMLLDSFGLGGIKLPLSPTKENSKTQALSIRDVFKVTYFDNSRLDSGNLLNERGNYVVARKLQQTIDHVFSVADPSQAQINDQIQEAERARNEAKNATQLLEEIVQDEYPVGRIGVELKQNSAWEQVKDTRSQIASLDNDEGSRQTVLDKLRQSLMKAHGEVRSLEIQVRNRESFIARLTSLTLQYADDKKKLVFLTQAEQLFDPLQITHCPACMAELSSHPHVTPSAGCSLCGTELSDMEERCDSNDNRALARRELTAVSRRLDHLNDYIRSLKAELSEIVAMHDRAKSMEAQAEIELNNVLDLPAPFLALRDQLTRKLAEGETSVAHYEQGARLWAKVEKAHEQLELRELQLMRLRKQRQESEGHSGRNEVVRLLSQRFGKILEDFGYPKLSAPILNERLIPSVRGVAYVNASSGGKTLISLAWALAMWETAFEIDALSPGFLIIDSPQKNLGHAAGPGDEEFADAKLVQNVYKHVEDWLAEAGRGAQIILVDNSPPASALQHVVVRFSGNPSNPPFGLIDDAVD